MTINISTEVNLVYWAELELSAITTFRSALSGFDINWKGNTYSADGKFLDIGTSQYEISIGNKPIEISVTLNTDDELYALNRRLYVRRPAKIWRASVDKDNNITNIQLIKNGFLDSHSNGEGEAIVFTVSSWLSIANDLNSNPGDLTSGAQAIRNIGLSALKKVPPLGQLDSAQVIVNSGLILGEILPELDVPEARAKFRTASSAGIGIAFAGTTLVGNYRMRALPSLTAEDRIQSDSVYHFFSNQSNEREGIVRGNDELYNLARFTAPFGMQAAYPFALVTEGLTTRVSPLSFNGFLQDSQEPSNFDSRRQQAIPTQVNNRRINFDDKYEERVGSMGPNVSVAASPYWLPPDRLVNPSGLLSNQNWLKLIRGEIDDDFTITTDAGVTLTAGYVGSAAGTSLNQNVGDRYAIAEYAYDKLIEERNNFINEPYPQAIEVDQVLAIGPADSVTLDSILFSNDLNKFTLSSSQSVPDNPSAYPDNIQITFVKDANGFTTAATTNAGINLVSNNRGGFTGRIYASVLNSYYAPVAIAPSKGGEPLDVITGARLAGTLNTYGPDSDQNSYWDDAFDTRPPVGAWQCIPGSSVNDTQWPDASYYPADGNGSFKTYSAITKTQSGAAGRRTRRNPVIEFTVYPGDVDGGKLCWIEYTFYNRAMEAALILSNPIEYTEITTFNNLVNSRSTDLGGANEYLLMDPYYNTFTFADYERENPNFEYPENAFKITYTVSAENRVDRVVRETLTTLLNIDNDLLDNRDASTASSPGTFKDPSILNQLNFNNLGGDAGRFSEPLTLANTALFPQNLFGSLAPNSYSEVLEEIHRNTGLMPIEEKAEIDTESDPEAVIYLYANLPRNSQGVNAGFAGVFDETNASFEVQFGRSSDIVNTYLGNLRVARTDEDNQTIYLNAELSLINNFFNQQDNNITNLVEDDLNLLQIPVAYNSETRVSTFDIAETTIPSNRAAYLIMSRRIGLDSISVNTDYNNAGKVRVGDFIQIQWDKFNWGGNTSVSARVVGIDDDNRGRITLHCQRHDNIMNVGARFNAFTTTFNVGAAERITTAGSTSTVTGGLTTGGGSGGTAVSSSDGATSGTTVVANSGSGALLRSISIDGTSFTLPSTVATLNSNDLLSSLNINGTNYNLLEVIANPTETDTDVLLQTLSINGVVHSLAAAAEVPLFYGFEYDAETDNLEVVCLDNTDSDTVRVENYLDWAVMPGGATLELDSDNYELILRL